MFKITLFSIIMLFGLVSFIGIEQTVKHELSTQILAPQDTLLGFSYDINLLQYQQLLGDSKFHQLKAHQKFSLVPQRQKMHVNGYLLADGSPYMEIKILEKTNRPWIKKQDNKTDEKVQIDKIIMDGDRIRSFDSRGNELISMPAGENKHMELAQAIISKNDPEEEYKKFLDEGRKKGWDIQQNEHSILVHFVENSKEFTMYFDVDTGLPEHSIIKSDHDITRVIYRYECIDGKYVLIFQQTRVSNEPDEPDEARMEYVNTIRMENVQFNQ